MLLCFGDSVTAQDHAWPRIVLVASVTCAVSGARAADVLGQLVGLPVCEAAVGSVGTNDVLQLGEPLGLDRLPALVERLVGEYQRVVLLDVFLFLPFHPWRYQRELRSRRRHVRAALQATGLPLLRPSLGPLCWQRDGIHPNRRYRKIGRSVELWLRTVRSQAA